MEKDIFWIDDITILFKNNKFLEFIPTNTMSHTEKLNAITRFSIYFSILILIFNKNENWLILSVIVILMCIFYHYILKKTNTEKFDATNDSFNENSSFDTQDDVQDKIETGYYDFSNKSHKGEFYKPMKHNKDRNNIYHSSEHNLQNSCEKPTISNPFMNTKITDFNNGAQPVACNADDEDIKNDIANKFNDNLFRNVDDIFETENSKRQFYTVPNTSIPNMQTEFAEWLWKPKTTCKEDQEHCLRYEDLRFRR